MGKSPPLNQVLFCRRDSLIRMKLSLMRELLEKSLLMFPRVFSRSASPLAENREQGEIGLRCGESKNNGGTRGEETIRGKLAERSASQGSHMNGFKLATGPIGGGEASNQRSGARSCFNFSFNNRRTTTTRVTATAARRLPLRALAAAIDNLRSFF